MTIEKLEKIKAAIEAAAGRGMTTRNKKAILLAMRYDESAREIRLSPGGCKAWLEYCGRHEITTTHQGHDFFA
jgi:hypothetical protein